ncbi:MAG: COX15/CtaA family protein [Polyangiales bacterium]
MIANIQAEGQSAAVRRWLWLVWALVFAMVVLGGVTRLTGSGLSITEWQPLIGALPPLHQSDWLTLFAKYQQSPQYRVVNAQMTLEGFKNIFFWEYLHRLVGRSIGAAVLLPWLYFVWRKRLPRALARNVLGVFALGGLQGLLGWYMVRSGLVDEPRVSHYRLAAHLFLAFLTGQLVLWLALDVATPRERGKRVAFVHAAMIGALLCALALQVVYGAFMAGTHAGYYYSSFPDMNGHYSPAPFFHGASWLRDAASDPSAIHYLHRAIAFALLFFALFVAVYLWLVEPRRAVARAALLVAALVFVQLDLGALTVLRRVALPLAVAHQAMAYLLASSATLLLHRALGSERRSRAPARSAQ